MPLNIHRVRPLLATILGGALLASLVAVIVPLPAVATFPGGNGRIVFVRGDDLYSMRPDGSAVLQLTDTPNRIESEPAWSPDGTKIAFVKNWNIFTINANGSGLTRITSRLGVEFSPAWSPNGREIVFTSERGGPGDSLDLWIKRLATGTWRRITYGMHAGPPDWSAPGVIVFPGQGPGQTDSEVYRVRPDGDQLMPLTANTVNEGQASISPDGSTVAYAAWTPATMSWDVYTVDAEGGVPLNVSDFEDGHDDQPVWSPDGTTIVFHSIRGSSNDLFMMDADGSDQRLIENGSDDDSYPDWRPITA